jgi:hypothetical protein
MTTPRRLDELQEFLDGSLGPARHAEIAQLIQNDPVWKREHAALESVFSLLSAHLDLAPPPDLVTAAIAQIQLRRTKRPRFAALLRFEKGLVALGAAGLAGALVLAGVIPPPHASQWVGDLMIEAMRYLSFFKATTVLIANGFSSFDWLLHLVGSLGAASQDVFISSMRELQPVLPGALLLTILTAIALVRAERGHRERGISGGMHLFA